MTDIASTSRSDRKRRIRKRRAQQPVATVAPLGARVARHVFVGMVAGGVIYSLLCAYQVWATGGRMRGISLGMTDQEVRDQLGAPGKDAQHPGVWRYGLEGNRLTLAFGRDQRVAELACEEEAIAQQPCANILGVIIHTGEAALKSRLGPPDQETFENNDKLVAYNGLGVVFRIRQSRIVAISEHAPGPFGARLLETFWVMLP